MIATNTNVAADQLGLVTETAFSTDEVIQPVIDRLGLDATPASVLANGELDAQSVSGGPALLIFGRAPNPQLAADLANAATDSFVARCGAEGIGHLRAVPDRRPRDARASSHRALGPPGYPDRRRDLTPGVGHRLLPSRSRRDGGERADGLPCRCRVPVACQESPVGEEPGRASPWE